MYVENEPQQTIEKDTSYASLLHLSSFANIFLPILGTIAPLIMWLSKKDTDAFVDAHGKSCLNFEISLLIYSTILSVLIIPITLFTLGIGLILLIPLGLFVFVYYIILKIQAAKKASEGEYFTYPYTLELIK